MWQIRVTGAGMLAGAGGAGASAAAPAPLCIRLSGSAAQGGCLSSSLICSCAVAKKVIQTILWCNLSKHLLNHYCALGLFFCFFNGLLRCSDDSIQIPNFSLFAQLKKPKMTISKCSCKVVVRYQIQSPLWNELCRHRSCSKKAEEHWERGGLLSSCPRRGTSSTGIRWVTQVTQGDESRARS